MRSGFFSSFLLFPFFSRSSFFLSGVMYKYQLRGRRRRTTPFPPSNLFHRSPPYQRHASIHQQRISHTHYSRIFPSLQSIHPSMAPAIKCRFSPPLYQRTPLFPTTYYPPMAGAPCHCYAPQPKPLGGEPGFSCGAQQAPWLVFFASASQSGKAEASSNSSFIDFNNRHSSAAFLSSFFLFFSFFPLSFLARSQLVCILQLLLYGCIPFG